MENKFAKKVIFLLPVLGGGGGERVVSNLSLYLPESIEKVVVAFEGSPYYPYKARIILMDIHLSTNLAAKFFIFLRAYLKFKKIVAKEHPDYVVSLGSMQSILNVLCSKNSVVRVGNPILPGHQNFFERFFLFLVRIFFNKAKKIIVISRGSEKELIDVFKIKKEKIQVIYNFIDVEKAKQLARELMEPEHNDIFKFPVVINVANLNSQKGQWHLIKAFGKVKEKIKNAKLVILGEGYMEKELKCLAKDLGLEKDVHFLGWQKNPCKFLARSKIFVLSSVWEGFGNVFLEAMACGLPVISFDCPESPREILAPAGKEEFGILVPLGNEELLGQAIFKMLSDEKIQNDFRSKSIQRSLDFDVKKIISQWSFLEK